MGRPKKQFAKPKAPPKPSRAPVIAAQVRHAIAKAGKTRKAVAVAAKLAERTVADASRSGHVHGASLESILNAIGWEWRALNPAEVKLIDGLREGKVLSE